MGNLFVAFGLSALRVFGFITDPLLSHEQIHRVVGEPTRINRPWMGREHLEVITWNIERGAAYDSVVDVLRALDADVVLLQEVDRGCHRTGYRNVARDLAAALGMNWVAAGEFQEIGESRAGEPAITGQAILSRFAIEGAEVLRFTAQDRWRWSINPVQPRRGGRIALKARTGGMLVYNTHIESGTNTVVKRQQIAEILSDEAATVTPGTPVLIAGDFNNGPIVRSPMLVALTAASFADALGDVRERSATSLGQREPIDWIFVKNVTSVRGKVVTAPRASDHFPVTAALDTAALLASSQ
jgi:endonuclease/exonuclease/phosphatase family metal-dependent hydrolase